MYTENSPYKERKWAQLQVNGSHFFRKENCFPRESEPHCEPHPPFSLARYFYFLQESWEREPDRAKGKRQKEGNKCNEKMDKYGREWNPKEPSLVHPPFFFFFFFASFRPFIWRNIRFGHLAWGKWNAIACETRVIRTSFNQTLKQLQ